MNDPDPEKRAQWERIPRAGGVAPVCGGTDRGRGARQSVALVSESLEESK